MEKVSTGLITISQRLRAIDEDGDEIDGLSAELSESFGKIGVAIEDSNGDLRSTYDILSDYAKIYPQLTSEQKQYYAELASGKRQVNVFNAIVQQIADVDKAMKDNEDLTGSWFYMDNSSFDDNERYYYYSVPVAPGDMTSRLINKVTYTGDIPENAHFELKVLAEGVSSKQEDSRADWGL